VDRKLGFSTLHAGPAASTVYIVPVTSAHVRRIAAPVIGLAPTSPVIGDGETSVIPVFVRIAKLAAVPRATGAGPDAIVVVVVELVVVVVDVVVAVVEVVVVFVVVVVVVVVAVVVVMVEVVVDVVVDVVVAVVVVVVVFVVVVVAIVVVVVVVMVEVVIDVVVDVVVAVVVVVVVFVVVVVAIVVVVVVVMVEVVVDVVVDVVVAVVVVVVAVVVVMVEVVVLVVVEGIVVVVVVVVVPTQGDRAKVAPEVSTPSSPDTTSIPLPGTLSSVGREWSQALFLALIALVESFSKSALVLQLKVLPPGLPSAPPPRSGFELPPIKTPT